MKTKASRTLSRRGFIGTSATALAGFTVVPRHVLGGYNYISPNDKITMAYIGCGAQGIVQLSRLVANPEIQVVAVCDPEKYSENYLEFSNKGLRNIIRRVLDKPKWGETIKGVPGGWKVGKEIVETYYANKRSTRSYKGCSVFKDFRDLLEKEQGVDSVKVMTPDHLHASIAIKAMKMGKHVVMHKPMANRVYETRLVVETARRTEVATHLLAFRNYPDPNLTEMIKHGAIGTLREVHNWTDRPFWPTYHSIPADKPPIPKDFNWDLYLGPALYRPYHPHYTHGVFRGWYDFGAGAIADMGFYSLWPIFSLLELPVPNCIEAMASTDSEINEQISTVKVNDFSFPNASQVRFRFPARGNKTFPTLYFYDGGLKPFAPEVLAREEIGIPNTGTLYVGDDGVILDNQIFPEKRRQEYMDGRKVYQQERRSDGWRDRLWTEAFKGGEPSPGNFMNASNCGEAIALAGAAVRYARKSFKTIFTQYTTPILKYDSQTMKFTNVPEANEYLVREYRKGWEL